MSRRFSIAALVVATALLGCKKGELPPAPLQSGTVSIAVTDEGFTPSKVRLEKGKPATLVFTRTSAHTCAERVKFKALHVDEALPLQTPVSINVPTDTAQTLAFTCGMDMYASSVVVE
jgi:plastocyanin domain-containing protein